MTASSWPGGGSGRVLAVLDNPVLAELIALTLNHGVCTVRTALTAVHVAASAAEWRPHLLILDMAIDSSAILSVPFAPEELLARTIALMRRSRPAAISFTPIIAVGGLEIDILNRTVREGAAKLRLTPLELGLLYLLAANPGRVLTCGEILETLWGVGYGPQTGFVEQHVRQLRARLQLDARLPQFIVTVPGRGYRFVAG